MSELLNRILEGKIKTRRELADLPFSEKLKLMEQIRERSALLAEYRLRAQSPMTKSTVVASEGVEAAPVPDKHKTESMPLVAVPDQTKC
jgi:hypothetical protein